MPPDATYEVLLKILDLYMKNNYDYLFLKSMLAQGKSMVTPGAALITGSSHALNAIYEPAWKKAVNCSMHSQDIYYDFQCAKAVLSSPGGRCFDKCFIVMGYYIAFQDLSLSTVMREWLISEVYYPLLQDAHHWETPLARDPWAELREVTPGIRTFCENAAYVKMLEAGTYYTDMRPRKSYFDLRGLRWCEVPEALREEMGRIRAESHNKLFQHKKSFEENKEILRDFVRYLYAHEVLPIVVITPFTDGYNRHVLPEMREAVGELVDSVPEDVQYVDFNESDLFTPEDFLDTDHLNLQGAQKASYILADMFGR